LLSALIVSACLLSGNDGETAQRPRLETLRIEDHRPLAKAIYELRLRHGMVVTYEDPPYVHHSEILDITEQFPDASRRLERGLGPRLLAVGRGRLASSYIVTPEGLPEDPQALLQDLLDFHAAAGNPGRFELREDGRAFHVVPTTMVGEDGRPAAVPPLMDARIVLARGERPVDQALDEFAQALRDATGAQIAMVSSPLFGERSVEVWADNEPARQVLWRILDIGAHRFTWGLAFDPTTRSWMFIVSLVHSPPGDPLWKSPPFRP
jgi:hypothetical protein